MDSEFKLSRDLLAGELAEEFLLVHSVFEGFAAINEDDRDLIVKLAAEVGIAVHINFVPAKSASARKLGKTFLDDFTEMAPFARVQDDAPEVWHAAEILARVKDFFLAPSDGDKEDPVSPGANFGELWLVAVITITARKNSFWY